MSNAWDSLNICLSWAIVEWVRCHHPQDMGEPRSGLRRSKVCIEHLTVTLEVECDMTVVKGVYVCMVLGNEHKQCLLRSRHPF